MLKKIISLMLLTSITLSSVSFADAINPIITEKLDESTTITKINQNVKNDFISIQSTPVTPEEIFGSSSWRLLESPKVYNYTHPNLAQWQSASIEGIKDIVLTKLGGLYNNVLGGSFLAILIADRFVEKPDYKSYGGVYTKCFYLAKPVNSGLESAKVPVACERKVVIVVYSSKYMRAQDIVFQVSKDDSVNSVAWYKLSRPSL